jgi:Ca2+-transporting ATPase
MKHPPRAPNAKLLSRRLMLWGLMQGAAATAAVVATLMIANWRAMPDDEMRALVFLSLVLANVGLIIVNRSFNRSLAAAVRPSNRALWVMLPAVALVMTVVVAWPPARDLFRLGPLYIDDIALCLAMVGAMVVGLEVFKPAWLGLHGRPRS